MDNYFNLNSDIYCNTKTFDEKFELFATYLLNRCVMYIGTQKYFLEEVEFYYHANLHKDEYVHKNSDQKTNRKWYFHKYSNGSYKSGTYKGLDLTFGSTTAFGGILIRAIENATTHEYIIGPCNVVNHILTKLDKPDVTSLVSSLIDTDAFFDGNPFNLKIEENANCRIFKGPRVGLSDKYPQYMFKTYRFLKHPNVTLKYKDTLIAVLHEDGLSSNEIQNLTGITKTFITKSIGTYEHGKTLSGVNKESNINVKFGFNAK